MKKPGQPLSFDYRILANEYGFYCFPQQYQHREIFKVVGQGGVYEPATLQFLKRHLGTGDIVTGGAFVGDFFPALFESLSSKAHIHTFEPNPVSFEAAEETIRLNNLKRIKLHQVAVGEQEDQLALRVSRRGAKDIAARAHIVEGAAPDDKHTIEVPVVQIDSFIPKTRRVSILHLDVEGFEVKALTGAVRVLSDSKPLVVLEDAKPWKCKHYAQTLNDLCKGAHYRHVGSMENNSIFRAF